MEKLLLTGLHISVPTGRYDRRRSVSVPTEWTFDTRLLPQLLFARSGDRERFRGTYELHSPEANITRATVSDPLPVAVGRPCQATQIDRSAATLIFIRSHYSTPPDCIHFAVGRIGARREIHWCGARKGHGLRVKAARSPTTCPTIGIEPLLRKSSVCRIAPDVFEPFRFCSCYQQRI